MRTSFRGACKKAGIEDFVFHDLRHAAVTNWRRAGIDMLTIMKVSGHRNIRMFKRYNTISREDLKRASNQVEGYLRNEMDTNMGTKEHATSLATPK